MYKESKIKKEDVVEENRIWDKVPKSFRRCLIWAYKFFIFLGTALGIIWVFFNVYDRIVYGSEKEKTDTCKNKVLHSSEFKKGEPIKWQGIENIDILDEEEYIVKPKTTQNFSGGRDIFFDKEISPNFKATLGFAPQNEDKINLAINYGYLFRFIVGNGDYNQVQMQYNSKYPRKNLKTEDWKVVEEKNHKKWIKINRRLQKKEKINITMDSHAVYNSNNIIVNIILIGFLNDSNERKEFNFSYEIETKENSSEFNEMVGIGLLDPHSEGIMTKLNEFKLYETN